MEPKDHLLRPPTRPIRRLLVANRGEIAARVISAARELGIETVAVYTDGDESHSIGASDAIELSSASSYLSIDELLHVVKANHIDAIHPGYGFLSESDVFAKRMWQEANAVVIGPGWDMLSRFSDKAAARRLAKECGVNVLPGLECATDDAPTVINFAQNDLPIMIKAVDGGGGRGIRLVREKTELANAVARAMGESPSGRVIAEKAAADGFHHVEVQIIGDGKGGVRHLWERECSIQRRFQKVIELAPSLCDRQLIARIINDAMHIARYVSYFSLGTFEFLLNPSTAEHYFLEVNPRLQVEHTITEQITLTDLVRCQLLLSQGASLEAAGLPDNNVFSAPPHGLHSIQLRVTAENAAKNWTLSTGQITSFRLPTGHGIRVDTCLGNRESAKITADFDSLLAKVIVTAVSWPVAVAKAKRALNDMYISGITTNLDILRAIIADRDFTSGTCDIQWLDTHHRRLVAETGQQESANADAESEVADLAGDLRKERGGSGPAVDVTKIAVPFSGKLVEVVVDVGDLIGEDDVVCVVQQMKMELEVRSPRSGRITWITPEEDGALLEEGTVVAFIEPAVRPKL